MSIFKTAYDTTAGKPAVQVMTKIVHTLKQVLVAAPAVQLGAEVPETDAPKLGAVTGRNQYEDDVPPFNHPLLMEDLHKKQYMFIDLRQVVAANKDDPDAKPRVRNSSEFLLARARLAMGKIWLTQGPSAIYGISPLPQQVFSAWISEGIGHRFLLTTLEQLQLAVITSFYYQSLFIEESEFDEDTRNRFTASIIRATKAPARVVIETTAKIGKMENITDFCNTIKDIVENERLREFNPGLLMTILKSSWWGNNAGEMLAVSLEYPPTWVSLIYVAMRERTYHNSQLAKITERFSKQGADNYYTRGFVALASTVLKSDDGTESF